MPKQLPVTPTRSFEVYRLAQSTESETRSHTLHHVDSVQAHSHDQALRMFAAAQEDGLDDTYAVIFSKAIRYRQVSTKLERKVELS